MRFFRPTFAEINLTNLESNYLSVRSLLPKGTGILAMVKADAYGHGAVPIAQRLEGLHVDAFGVATVEEGVELREAGIRSKILVMGGLMGMGSPASWGMVRYGLTPVVHSASILEDLDREAGKAGKKVEIHLKVDTGMTRLGLLPNSVEALLSRLKDLRHLELAGVMTHLAAAEDEAYASVQLERFSEVLAKVKNLVGVPIILHLSNSAAILRGLIKVDGFDKWWVRPGIALYGGSPFAGAEEKMTFRPVMHIKSMVSLIKVVPDGTKVGYLCTYETRRRTKVGVVPIGYADGYPLALSNKGIVLVGGIRLPVIGRVSMDMITVDLTDADAHVGDEVVLLGEQGDERITVDELALLAGTISYELLCRVSKRMPRVYVG